MNKATEGHIVECDLLLLKIMNFSDICFVIDYVDYNIQRR